MAQTIDHITFSAVQSYGLYAEQVCGVAQRHLRILSTELPRAVFEQAPLLALVSALARRHRDNDVRILVRDIDSLLERRHGLLVLARRLPSAIRIRRLAADDARDLGELVLADEVAVLHHPDPATDHAYACSPYGPRAQDLAVQFDAAWHRSERDIRLRELFL